MKRIRKIAAIALAFALLALASGCGRQSADFVGEALNEGIGKLTGSGQGESPADAPAPAEEPAPEAEPEPVEEPEPTAEPAEEAPAQSASFSPDFSFSTTALDGTAFDESVFAGHKLTMINFFEPWCGPCVHELPELERLYEDLADEGFYIIGVFSTEDGVAEVLKDAGVSYPALRYVPEFDQFQTGYVPTTIFVDGDGHIVGETKIGSNSYDGWLQIVKGLMG